MPGFNTDTPTRVQLVSISYVKVVNSSQVNEARLGWNRFAEGFFPEDQGFRSQFHWIEHRGSAYDSGLPAISVGGFSRLGRQFFGAAQSRRFQLALRRQLFLEDGKARHQIRI